MRAVLFFLITLPITGCASLWIDSRESAPVDPPAEARAGKIRTLASEQELRLRTQRLADDFFQAISEPLDRELSSKSPLPRRRLALDMKYHYGSTVYTIAAGPHAAVAVIDMCVFMSLTRDTIERWGVEFVGEAQTDRLLHVFRNFEADSWELARTVLNAEQEELLRRYLLEWRERNPDRKYVESVRLSEFIGSLDLEDRERAKGLMDSVRNATAAADEALVLAERLTYFVQRAPLIWRMHAQIGFLDIVDQPEMQGILSDIDQISSSADSLAGNVDRLTSLLAEGPKTPEETALLENLLDGELRVRTLINDLGQTLQVANALVANVEGLAVRFDVGGPTEPGKQPFNVRDYEQFVGQFTEMSKQMTDLVTNLNQLLTSPTLNEALPLAVGSAQNRSEEFVRYLAVLALILIFTSVLIALTAVLGYRYLAARLDARFERRQ